MASASAPKGPLRETFAKVAAMTPRQLAQPEVSASSISSLETADQSSTTNTSFSSGPLDGQCATQMKTTDANAAADDQSRAKKMEQVRQSVGALQLEDTSAATSALDEKESLRPDDSASTKATEEEECFAAAATGGASSRLGSEPGARAFRSQFNEISEHMGYPAQPPLSSGQQPGSEASGTDVVQAVTSSDKPVLPSPDAAAGSIPFGFTKLDPDEKLLEALENPKDRLFVLRVERDVIEFVRDSKEPILELPPCNSFCRLLIHKLAEYYFLTHFVDPTLSAVRLHRTPFCRLRVPLVELSNPPTSRNTPPPNGPAVKIMRRDNLDKDHSQQVSEGTLAASSQRVAQAGSVSNSDVEGDSGRDTTDTSVREKGNLTREEREAKYREARERIFKGFDEADGDERRAAADQAKQTSRSSSRASKNKSSGKKVRSAADDGFAARSQFAPYYPPPHPPPSFQSFTGTMPYGSFLHSQVHVTGNLAASATVGRDLPSYSQGYVQQMPSQPGAAYAAATNPLYFDSPGNDARQAFTAAPQSQFGAPAASDATHHLYPSAEHDNTSFPSTLPTTYPPNSNFRPPFYPQSHPSHGHWSQPPAGGVSQVHSPPNSYSNHLGLDTHPEPAFSTGMTTPYPYGQLPNQQYHPNLHRVNYQHPVPGSFNRHAFNPRTQPFVPGGKPPGGQSNAYPTSVPQMAGFQAAFYPPGSSQSAFGPHAHGSGVSKSPVMTHSQFGPMGNSRPSSAPQGFPSTTLTSNEAKMGQRPHTGNPMRWPQHQHHHLPPKPPVVTSPSRGPHNHYGTPMEPSSFGTGERRFGANSSQSSSASGPTLSQPPQVG